MSFESAMPEVYAEARVSREIEEMHAAIGGDAAAMRSIYQREAPALQRRLCHLCGDRSLAQDLLQDTFLRAFSGQASFAGSSRAGTWLHGIAVNLWRNEVRKRGRRRLLLRRGSESVEPRALAAPDEGQVHDELQAQLHRALDRLHPELREAYVLRVIEELPLAQAAALTKVSQATLSRRAHRAEELVRKHFEQASGLDLEMKQ
jgi:RNA polymerase sigma-70 factor (ECF subfamily)